MIDSVGPYKIGDLITETSQSMLFTTKNEENQEKLMIKLIKNTRSVNAKYECDAMTHLYHPNIIQAVGIYKMKEYIGIVMPYFENGDLFDFLIENELSEYASRRIINQILEAVEYMHSKGYWHRDIKAENIFIRDIDEYGPNVVLGDLGFARKFSEGEISREYCGTYAYESPEMILKNGFTSKVDLWAIGVLTFILLGRYLPFQGDRQLMFKNIINGIYSFNNHVWQSKSEECKIFISSLLKIDSKERPTATESLCDNWFSLKLKKPKEFIDENENEIEYDSIFDFAFPLESVEC